MPTRSLSARCGATAAGLLAATLTSGVLTTTPATGATAPAAAAAAAAKDDVRDLRVMTYNIRAGVSLTDFKDAITEVKPDADVIALQEIGSNERNKWLLKDTAWGYHRPPQLQQNPILWDRSLFEWTGADGYKIAEERDLHGEHSGDEAKGDSWATVVRLQDRLSGQRLSFINVHLVRGAVKGGLPAPGKPNLFKLYTDQVAGTVKAIKAERARNDVDQVFVLGDFNVGFKADLKRKHKKLPYKKFKAIGFQSMWQGSPYLKGNLGTHNDALIDQVWTSRGADSEEILTGVKQSDHYPALALYGLEMKAGYTAQGGTIGFKQGEENQAANEGNGKKKQCDLAFDVTGDLSHGHATLDISGTADWSDTYQEGDYLIDVTELYDLDTSSPARICIDFQGDSQNEVDETIVLTLTDPSYTTLMDPVQAVGTILNDD